MAGWLAGYLGQAALAALAGAAALLGLLRLLGVRSSLRAAAALGWALLVAALALLPLPGPGGPDCAAAPAPLLVPFAVLGHVVAVAGEGGVAALLADLTTVAAAANLAAFAVLGALAAPWLGRASGRASGGALRLLLRAGLAGLAVSLAIETAQASALLGLYPCPWRRFDVDDLILNAAGMALGALAAGPRRRRAP